MTDPRQIEGVDITSLERGLAQVVIQPGASIPALGDTTTVNVLVKDGALRVSISEGAGEVRTGSGQPIASGDAGTVFCEGEKRDLQIGDSAVLTAGNSCFVRDGVLNLDVVGDQAVELHMGAQPRGGDRPERLPGGAQAFKAGGGGGGGKASPLRCWLCPFM
jgi:hypothetical protein